MSDRMAEIIFQSVATSALCIAMNQHADNNTVLTTVCCAVAVTFTALSAKWRR